MRLISTNVKKMVTLGEPRTREHVKSSRISSECTAILALTKTLTCSYGQILGPCSVYAPIRHHSGLLCRFSVHEDV